MLEYDDIDEHERQYSPSSIVPDAAELIGRYRSGSAAVRSARAFETVAYGPDMEQYVDIFWGASSRVHVFIHGGYWQELSGANSSFLAPSFCERGTSYVGVGYRLAPRASVEEILADIDLALRVIRQRVVSERGDCQIVLSGSSAGAHLAAMTARSHRLAGLMLISGIYDIVPLIRTYVNDALSLDHDRAARLSPLRLPPPATTNPTVIAFGELETDAFKQQSEAFASHWNLPPPLEIAGRNHFDVVHDLADVSTILGRAALAMEDHGV
ncbi:MAG: alpha/beta hydrolase fold domain-containing protein [Acidimicrobiia bacterium]|nr:alpha/beta hydrolase fold domain-containing protein [Acidimicrobiia bacterium]